MGLLGILVLACFLVLGVKPKHRITQESARLIRSGMTETEVEALLGRPPGDYTSSPGGTWIQQPGDDAPDASLKGERKTWKSDEVMITVILDPFVVVKPVVWLRKKVP